jgi:hypothetical protein
MVRIVLCLALSLFAGCKGVTVIFDGDDNSFYNPPTDDAYYSIPDDGGFP